jgi:hypothetical protein
MITTQLNNGDKIQCLTSGYRLPAKGEVVTFSHYCIETDFFYILEYENYSYHVSGFTLYPPREEPPKQKKWKKSVNWVLK